MIDINEQSIYHAVQHGYCIICGEDAVEFITPLSRTVYEKSGICENCQSEVNGLDPEDINGAE